MPDGDGLDVCRRARHNGFSRSVLMLTARDLVTDRVEEILPQLLEAARAVSEAEKEMTPVAAERM